MSGVAGGVPLNIALTIVSASTCAPLAGYAGRWPHIHFEVYPNLAAATNSRNKSATSQLALPKSSNDLAYAVAGYEQSIRNAAQVTLASDNVFSDGSALELATMSGSVSGFTATLTVAI